MEPALTIVIFFAGLIALVTGAQLLIRGASKLAVSFGISPLVVGLTVVALGTSAPELAVSVRSAWGGQVDLALGNAVGSNIFNTFFILGVSALLTPLLVAPQLIRQEVPVMIGSGLLLLALAMDGSISRIDGLVLAGLLVAYTVFIIRQSRQSERTRQVQADAEAPTSAAAGTPDKRQEWDAHWAAQTALIVGGLVLLIVGANWLVEAAVIFARQLGLSEMAIGLTVVAAGTSLPEVATSVAATLRGERDIAVGNVIGSNTFNILGVLGLSSLFSPVGLTVQPAMIGVDLPIMVIALIACLPIFFTGNIVARWEGALLLFYYLAYTAYLLLASQGHPLLPGFSSTMVNIVAPLTIVLLAALAARQWRRQR